MTLRLRPLRWIPCSALRINSREKTASIVPPASTPHAWGQAPTISSPVTVGIRWLCQTFSSTVLGLAVPECVPTSFNAGPGPVMIIFAVPDPMIDTGPMWSRSTTTVLVSRYTPRGMWISPRPESTARWNALVSSALPSPTAPKSRTVGHKPVVSTCLRVFPA
ncbi:hypothetical protein ES703_75909 [subsurface metagenome]